jgi:hypothetical protein
MNLANQSGKIFFLTFTDKRRRFFKIYFGNIHKTADNIQNNTRLLYYIILHVCNIFFITFQTSVLIYKLDIHESVHRDIITKVTNKM